MEFRQALPVGSILAGDYRVTGVLGQGGFGLTYKADDGRLGLPVAIKEYFPSEIALREHGSTVVARSAREQGVLEWGRAKFLEEARTLARFRHPNIVRVARLFEANNTAYMVLDFEAGPSLAQWRTGLGRPPTQAEIDAIARKLLEAVEAVHDAGILHRDIKPGNVIMRDGIEPVLIDFGAARQAFSAQSRTVHAIVTPGYSPKEQYAVDLDRQGAWSDIYALGATLFYLVTGKAPPDALSRDLGDRVPMATDGTGAYRPSFVRAIEGAMSIRPEDRPQSVADLRAQLFGGGGAASAHQGAGAGGSRPPPTGTLTTAGRAGSATAPARPAPAGAAPRRVTFDDIPSGKPAPDGAPRGATVLVVSALVGGLLALGFIWYWVAVLAPERDDAAWRRAVAANTGAAYERYLAEQPSGRHVAEASRRRQAAALEAPPAVALGTPAPAQPAPAPAQAAPASEPAASPQALPVPAAAAPPAPLASPASTAPAPAPGPTAAVPTPLPPRGDDLAERASLPAALTDAEAERLAQTVTAAKWRLAIGPFAGERVTGFTDQMTDFVAELGRLSGARLEATVLAGDANIARGDIMRQVRTDRDLLGWHAPFNSSGRRIEFAILAGTVPFGLAPSDHVRWLRAEGANLLERAYANSGTPVRAIPCGIAGGVGAWFRKEIRSPQELRELKVRGPFLIAQALRRLGAEPVEIAANRDLGRAFAASRVDANFGVSPLAGVFLATPRPAAVYHHPGVHSPSFLFDLVIGVETWKQMTEPQRRLVDDACRRNLDRWATNFQSSQNAVIDRIRTQRIVVRPFTGPTLEALRKAVDEVLAEEAANNARFREVLESYNRFRR